VRLAAIVLAAAALAAAGAVSAAVDGRRALETSRAAVGSQPAAHAFTDTNGRRVSLADYRGKPLVVSLVYTGCSQVCPTTTRFLKRAVAEARGAVGADAFDVVSIGFNIPADNPVSMKVFARENGIDDARWSFLTPDAGVPEALAKDLGFTYSPQSGGFEHLAQVTILDAGGRVYAQVYGESFALPMLVGPLRELVLGEAPAPRSVGDWLERVRLVCTVYDPVTGTYRLDYALFMEMAAGTIVLGAILVFLIRERRRARRSAW
jgi:protein SCO1/2